LKLFDFSKSGVVFSLGRRRYITCKRIATRHDIIDCWILLISGIDTFFSSAKKKRVYPTTTATDSDRPVMPTRCACRPVRWLLALVTCATGFPSPVRKGGGGGGVRDWMEGGLAGLTTVSQLRCLFPYADFVCPRDSRISRQCGTRNYLFPTTSNSSWHCSNSKEFWPKMSLCMLEHTCMEY